MKFKKIIKRIILLFIILASLFLGIQIYVDLYAHPYITDNLPKCSAIIVPGASVKADGTPSPVLKSRLENAYRLYASGNADKILVSGDHRVDDYNEVKAMENYLISLGVDKNDIMSDHAGLDTYDSMYRAKNIFKLESVIISTQGFHIHRAVYTARKLGINAYGSSCDNKFTNYLNFRESLAKVKAAIETFGLEE